jgi:hypothetical protein
MLKKHKQNRIAITFKNLFLLIIFSWFQWHHHKNLKVCFKVYNEVAQKVKFGFNLSVLEGLAIGFGVNFMI